ncbi:MAG: hydroxyacid dehydrogenase [Planctomycetota bacterium]|nr:hydroxyacid dehydrogenase [Planctomycetota bacterium]
MAKKVLLNKPVHEAGMKVLAGKAEPVVAPDASAETIRRLAADVEGILLRTGTQIGRDIIEAAPKLKVISRTGAGVDTVDVAAAGEKGILICHTPGVNSPSVAEHAVALLLALAKQLKPMDRAVAAGNWKIRNTYKAVDLAGKTLGLVGIGRIGMLVAAKCRTAFEMKTIAYDPFVEDAEDIDLCADLKQVFRQADFVSIHVPYTKQTHHLVGAELLACMKPDACLINTARGAVVDEKALTAALQGSAIAGAGLDVFDPEPPSPDNPLFKLDNVIATPHTAALSSQCVARVAAEAAQAVVDVFSGKRPKYIYNPDALKSKNP